MFKPEILACSQVYLYEANSIQTHDRELFPMQRLGSGLSIESVARRKGSGLLVHVDPANGSPLDLKVFSMDLQVGNPKLGVYKSLALMLRSDDPDAALASAGVLGSLALIEAYRFAIIPLQQ